MTYRDMTEDEMRLFIAQLYHRVLELERRAGIEKSDCIAKFFDRIAEAEYGFEESGQL